MSHICDGRDRSCASCQALGRRLDAVRGAMTVDDDLDDIRRARIWTQLEDRLGEGAPVRRSRWAVALGGGAAAAVAAAAVIALWPHRDELHTLTVPVDTTVASRLGPHTAASIIGPAELELLAGAGDATAVRLHRGTLLAEFDGGAGRSLRVEARGAIVEVVGTLFAVEVRGGTTCTSVVHGRVKVTTAAGAVFVGAGEQHCTGDGIRPIGDEVRAALLRHGGRSEPGAAAAGHEAQPPQRPADQVADPRTERADLPAAPATPAAAPSTRQVAPAHAAVAPSMATTVPPQPAAAPATRAVDAPSPVAGTRSSPAGGPPIAAGAPSRAAGGVPTAAGAPSRAAGGAPTAAGARSRAVASPKPSAGAPSRAPAAPPPSAAPSITAAGSRGAAGSPETAATQPPPGAAAPSTTRSGAAPGPRIAAVPPAMPPSSDPPPHGAARAAGPRPTPDELYRAAEAALAARDLAAADRALAALVSEYPASALVDQALYERARIAYQQHAWGAARSHLAQLAAMSSAPFAEPGHYLRCRIAVETGEASASACLVDYRAAFPRSPHDLDALALLVQLAHASAGCRGAAALIDELVQSHPRTTLAAAWRGRCPELP